MTEIKVGSIIHLENGTPSGLLLIVGPSGVPVLALKFDSEDEGKTLGGTVTYVEGQPLNFKATRTRQNWYEVEIEVDHNPSQWDLVTEWQLGSREEQNIVAMDITSPDEGSTLTGTMTYVGEEPIRLTGIIEKVGLLYNEDVTTVEVKVEPGDTDEEHVDFLQSAPPLTTSSGDKPVVSGPGLHVKKRPTISPGAGDSSGD